MSLSNGRNTMNRVPWLNQAVIDWFEQRIGEATLGSWLSGLAQAPDPLLLGKRLGKLEILTELKTLLRQRTPGPNTVEV